MHPIKQGFSILIIALIMAISGPLMADKHNKIEDPRFKPLPNPAKPNTKPEAAKQPRNITPTRPRVAPTPQFTSRKIFNITGAQAIAAAKRYGYTFQGDESCPFNGVNGWMAYPHRNNAYCRMDGFWNRTGRSHCSQLRQGWELKDMKFSREFDWMVPWSRFEPRIRLTLDSEVKQGRSPLIIILESVTLVGPKEALNADEAFSHCAETNYSPN